MEAQTESEVFSHDPFSHLGCWTVVGGANDSESVHLVRGAAWSRSFVKPNKPEKPDRRDEPEKPDGAPPSHAPRTV